MLAQIPAFFVPAVIAATFGATAATDTFFLAFAVASFVVNSVNGATQAAVPFLVPRGQRLLRRGTWLLVATAVALLLVALLVAGPVLERWSGLDAVQRGGVAALLVALGPFVVLSTVSAMWAAATNARGDYLVAAWAQGARSVAVVGLVLVVGRSLGVWGLVLAFVAAELARAVMLWAKLHNPAPPGPAEDSAVNASALGRSLMAQVAGSAVLGAVPIIDRAMASSLGPGSVSVLEYAERLWQVPLSLAMTGFTVVSLTEWSRGAQPGSPGHMVRQQAAAIARVFFLTSLPFCLAFALFREPITRLLFGYGAFPDTELPRLAATLTALLAGVPVYLVGLVYSRVFLAAGRSDMLLAAAAIGVVLKIALNTALARHWGLAGLAAATSAMHATNTLLLVATCPRAPSPAPLFESAGGPDR